MIYTTIEQDYEGNLTIRKMLVDDRGSVFRKLPDEWTGLVLNEQQVNELLLLVYGRSE